LAELTGTLRELAVADLSFAGSMTIDANIVRRVNEDNVRPVVHHQSLKGSLRRCIAAMNVMASELPDVAELANLHPRLRTGIIDILDNRLTELLNRQIDLGQAKPCDRQIKIPVELFQLKETLTEQPLIPMSVLRQPIVRNPQCLDLCRREMPDLDNWYERHAKLFSCQNPPMADDYLTSFVRYYGHHETKLSDGIRELVDLPLRMLPWVPRIQDEFCHGPIFNLNLDQAGVGRRVRLVRHYLIAFFLSELPNPRR
jgi:hypothetical protein